MKHENHPHTGSGRAPCRRRRPVSLRPAALLVLAACLGLQAAGCSARSRITAEVVGTDSVQFVPVRRSQGQLDCPADRAARTSIPLCRERLRVNGALLRARATAGETVLRHGQRLTFFQEFDSTVTGVELIGGLQYPMSRILGTDTWVVTLRIRSLDAAIISYSFAARGASYAPPAQLLVERWRGPSAPAPPPRADSLEGRVTLDSIRSESMGGYRPVLVYTPPAVAGEPIAGVVYMGDGGAARPLAHLLEPLIVTRVLPRIMLVGIPSGASRPGDAPGIDPRTLEYIWGVDTANARFLAHERFVRNEVVPWAEREYGAPAERSRRALFGISNSGAWAIDMALRNPELALHVIAFSAGGRLATAPAGARYAPALRFHLLSGTLEPGFQEVAKAWADSLRARGLEVTRVNAVAGHDWLMWSERFGGALHWAFGSPAR